jgi:hypothetical protein
LSGANGSNTTLSTSSSFSLRNAGSARAARMARAIRTLLIRPAHSFNALTPSRPSRHHSTTRSKGGAEADGRGCFVGRIGLDHVCPEDCTDQLIQAARRSIVCRPVHGEPVLLEPPLASTPEAMAQFEEPAAREELAGIRRLDMDVQMRLGHRIDSDSETLPVARSEESDISLDASASAARRSDSR